jgi:hypothetical protein
VAGPRLEHGLLGYEPSGLPITLSRYMNKFVIIKPFGGETGIRTLEGVTLTSLAVKRFRPLSHLSINYRKEFIIHIVYVKYIFFVKE